MIALRVLLFLAGAAAVLVAVRSVIRTFMVPRALRNYLTRVVFRAVRKVFGLRASERADYPTRDRVMAYYAPVALIALLVMWVAILLIGFTAMFYALGGLSVIQAFTFAGSAMFTLGFASRDDAPTVFLDFVAAGTGLVFLALFITYLPSLYASFQRRERGVAKLEVRAGQPPTGVYLIELAWVVGRLENLRDLWAEWEDWFTDSDMWVFPHLGRACLCGRRATRRTRATARRPARAGWPERRRQLGGTARLASATGRAVPDHPRGPSRHVRRP